MAFSLPKLFKNRYFTYFLVTFVVVLAMLGIAAYVSYSATQHTPNFPDSFQIGMFRYAGGQVTCTSPSELKTLGYDLICSENFHIVETGANAITVPSQIIFSYYVFNNKVIVADFINNVKEGVNTSPKPDGNIAITSNVSSCGNVTHTEVDYRIKGKPNSLSMAYASYVYYKNYVLSASAAELNYKLNATIFKSYVDHALADVSKTSLNYSANVSNC